MVAQPWSLDLSAEVQKFCGKEATRSYLLPTTARVVERWLEAGRSHPQAIVAPTPHEPAAITGRPAIAVARKGLVDG
jgi:hypothetical protein